MEKQNIVRTERAGIFENGSLNTFALSAALVSCLLGLPASALDRWAIDPAQSSIEFKISNMKVNTVKGSFSKVSGDVVYNGRNAENAAVNASIDVASVDTHDAKRDEHLRKKDFFEVATFPVATFKSTRVTSADGSNFVITGTLNLHGVSKEVVLMAKKEAGTEPGKLSLVATTKLNRHDFGIDYGPSVIIGDTVDLTLRVQLSKPAPETGVRPNSRLISV